MVALRAGPDFQVKLVIEVRHGRHARLLDRDITVAGKTNVASGEEIIAGARAGRGRDMT